MTEPAVLFMSADKYGIGITPDRTVSLFFEYEREDAPWLPSHLRLAIELTATQCRQLAQALERKADEAGVEPLCLHDAQGKFAGI